MTLTRRIALFIAAVLLLALGGALAVHILTARQAIERQQDMRNRDAAASLALALSQQQGQKEAMATVAAAQFDLGHYRRIVLAGADAQPVFALQRPAADPAVPGWFVQLLPLSVQPGTAIVSSGWQELGRLTVEADSSWGHEALWRAALRIAVLLAALGCVAVAVSVWMLRAWQRPLQATVAQAQALEQGRFVEAALPDLPELELLTRSMNATVRRLREMFALQAQQVAWLQRRAQLDALTGLPLAPHFAQALERRLNRDEGPGLALLWLRIGGLEQLNQAQGRAMADSVLQAAAEVLKRQQQAEPDSLVGRVSGSDFGLCLPVPGMAAELAPALYRNVREAVSDLLPGITVRLAALEGQRGRDAEALVAAGHAALERAATGGGLWIGGVLPGPGGAAAGHPAGSAQPADALQAGMGIGMGMVGEAHAGRAFANLAAWQEQLGGALAEHRARLGEYAVRDAAGGLIHLECPLRLQLEPGGDYLPAGRWLALARRCGVMPAVDRMAIRLALQACAADHRPRAVNVTLGSLASPGFVHEVEAWLAAAPGAAQCLWIEWVDGGPTADWAAAEQAIAAWGAHGVRMGVEHAGAAPEQLTRLRDLGLSYVKVDGLHLRGAATDASVNAYARSLVGLIQLLGLQALAEGVDRPEDLTALWQLGFEGATGSALRPGTPGERPAGEGGGRAIPAQQAPATAA